MTDQTEYRPRPHRTLAEVEALVAFITARVDPLYDAALDNPEERKGFDALLRLTAYIGGYAGAIVQDGKDPHMQFHALALAARKWKEHPDFQSTWADYA